MLSLNSSQLLSRESAPKCLHRRHAQHRGDHGDRRGAAAVVEADTGR
jgi:hypothetical protein